MVEKVETIDGKVQVLEDGILYEVSEDMAYLGAAVAGVLVDIENVLEHIHETLCRIDEKIQ